MGRAIIGQRDQHRVGCWQHLAVEFDARDTAANSVRILDLDDVSGGAVSENDFEVSPSFRDAGIHQQSRAAQTKSKYPLETRPIHPSGGAAIPGPAATSDMRRLGIDVATGNVRFNFVAMDAGSRAG